MFAEDLERCERCGGRMRWNEVATTPEATKRLNDELNLLGAEGWECLGVVSPSGSAERPSVLLAYKRPKL